jgi:hypothetical protein
MPVTAKGLSGVTLSVGNGVSVSSPGRPFAIRHGRHKCSTCLIVWRAPRIRNSSRSSARIMRTPKWWRRIWVCIISNFVKWCCPSKSDGWRCSRDSLANCSRPPSRINPSSKQGSNVAIFEPSGSGKFYRSALNSAAKHSPCTACIQ